VSDNRFIKKMVVLGPESSGKTTLCEALASHFQTSHIPEFARSYLNEKGGAYQYEDLEIIARGQIKNEEESIKLHLATQKIKPIFFDTNLEVIKIWSQEIYGKCSQFILNELAVRKYDFYFLCKPDLPWVHDPLRENPEEEKRWRHYHLFLDAVLESKVPFGIIEGIDERRIKMALDIIQLQLLDQ
jgi:NadR type nicotinamide-nucleotide adenylyltransferase